MSEGTVVLEFAVPTDWPPSADTLVFSGIHNGSKISVEAGTDAKLRFTCLHGTVRHDFITPELQMPRLASLKAAFSWGAGEDPIVAINGVLFSRDLYDPGNAIVLTSKDGEETRLRDPLLSNFSRGLNLPEETLIRSLIELQERIATADRVNLLEASSILRRLLLDSYPLVNRVNRKYKLRLRYPVAIAAQEDTSTISAAYTYINLAPVVTLSGDIEELTLDQFLSQPAVIGCRPYSVRDIIDFCANTKGGVHFDDPKSDISKELVDLDDLNLPELVDASLHAIADFSWCVIQGLRPLVVKIESVNVAT